MVIGPFINASAVLLGGVLGALLSQRLPERIRVSMTSIFGLASLGIAVSVISIPLLIIQLTLAWAAALILPLTTPSMMADFSAVGGLLLLATGLRICGIKMFPVVNMLPALLLAMPLSAAWTAWFA
ncbi:TPA: DUF554 family protein [Escherichia coli]